MCYVHNQWYDISCATLYLKVDLFLLEELISHVCLFIYLFFSAHLTAPTTSHFQILICAGRMWA